MVSISWDQPEPKCSAHPTNSWCDHVALDIRNRQDVIRVPFNGEARLIQIPIAPVPSYEQQSIPKATVLLRRDNDDKDMAEVVLAWDWDDDVTLGYEPIDNLHRVDIRSMVLPYIMQWELDHPCPCRNTHYNLTDMIGQLAATVMGAYRLAMNHDENTCPLCDVSDLVPDIPTGYTPTRKRPDDDDRFIF